MTRGLPRFLPQKPISGTVYEWVNLVHAQAHKPDRRTSPRLGRQPASELLSEPAHRLANCRRPQTSYRACAGGRSTSQLITHRPTRQILHWPTDRPLDEPIGLPNRPTHRVVLEIAHRVIDGEVRASSNRMVAKLVGKAIRRLDRGFVRTSRAAAHLCSGDNDTSPSWAHTRPKTTRLVRRTQLSPHRF